MSNVYNYSAGVIWVSTPLVDWTEKQQSSVWAFIEQRWLRSIIYELPKQEDNGSDKA
jgi:hypothetical protein